MLFRLLIAISFAFAPSILAQLSYIGGTVAQDFNGLPASGTFTLTGTGEVSLSAAPISAGSMNGWSMAPTGAAVTPKFRIDSGSSTQASHLSCGGDGQSDRALGVQASGSYIGRLGLVLVNDTGAPLTEFTLTFTGEQWRNGGSGVANTLTFAYAINASSITTGTYTTVPTLNFISPVVSTSSGALDGNAAGNRSVVTATVTNVHWGVGQTLVLRWSDADDTGSDDALAIDDLTFAAAQNLTPSITRIHAVQGSGVTSPLNGAVVTVEAVVTGDYQGPLPALGGFYLQERAADVDANAATSEGIFVSDDGSYDVSVGDVVRVTGTVSEVVAVTTITSPTSIVKIGSAAVPAVTPITLPPATTSGLERYEGMRVQIDQLLTVVETNVLGSSGQLMLSSAGALETPTEFMDPNDVPASGVSTSGSSNVPAISAQESLNTRLKLLLDDASLATNPDPTPYLNLQHTRRCGDTLSSLMGYLSYASSVNKIQPIGPVVFTDANPRPASAPGVGGRIKVAGMNALNYFLTLGSRGALNAYELQRQQDKLVAQIIGLDADVVGLMEIENIGTAAIDALTAAVNAALGSAVYARVPEPSGAGVNVIRVAMIYKPAVVTPDAVSHTDADSVWDRQPLAVCMTENSTGARFIVCVNHFKSKTGTDASGADLDQNDGQGAFNQRRTLQSARLINFMSSVRSSTGTDNALIIGDLNAYSQEDPIDTLRASGYADLTAIHAPGSYSYAFDGLRGHLDHAFGSAQFSPQITGVANWHINADEPAVLDYSLTGKSPVKQAINVGTFYRASDHDPVLIGLELTPPSVTYATWAASIGWPPGAASTPAADADHDGMSNLEELLYGANPLVQDVHLRPVLTIDSGTLRFDYRQRHTVTGYSVIPQWSANLQHWTDLTPGAVLNDLTPVTQSRRAILSTTGQPQLFMRLDLRP